MFKIAVVIFRECLEIAILLGIIMAITKPIKNSRIYIILGALIGVTLASFIAFGANYLSNIFGGFGDEIFDASIILATSVMISIMVVWMQGYNLTIRAHVKRISDKFSEGDTRRGAYILVFLVATAMLREVSEIILFIYSIASAQQLAVGSYIMGLWIGGGMGLLCGTLLYMGLIRFASSYIFKISTMLLIFISAGLASHAAGILISAGIIELWSDTLWDSSWLIANESITGKLLNIVFGYDATPTIMQFIFYLGAIGLTMLMMLIRKILTSKR